VARGVFLETSTSESGTHPPQVVLGPRLSNHPPRWLGRAAYHGEHNEEIFKNSLEESIESCVCDLEKPALEMDNDASPLHGVKVLDLTRLLPGPLCTHVLVRLGASVVKVEAPDGDYARFVPPLIK
jgi:crotonobetainyl-CoA:carnitine CoA-transferase CaiB-like acyl-CoA transferase